MIPLSTIKASNSTLAASLPPSLIAVFIGATSGIGEATLKLFAAHTTSPRIYFVGRNQDAANRIVAECRMLNPEGSYEFIRKDVSLIKNVDELCNEIEKREKRIDLLFLSPGEPDMDWTSIATIFLSTTSLLYRSDIVKLTS